MLKPITLVLLTILLAAHSWPTATHAMSPTADDYSECEDQLDKYRHFLLQAILTFEDVCDSVPTPDGDPHQFVAAYNPQGQERQEIWAFFKLLMAQFNDTEFASVIREAVVQRCHAKSQRGEKRNSLVLGKKQKFHSWGGKRAVFEE